MVELPEPTALGALPANGWLPTMSVARSHGDAKQMLQRTIQHTESYNKAIEEQHMWRRHRSSTASNSSSQQQPTRSRQRSTRHSPTREDYDNARRLNKARLTELIGDPVNDVGPPLPFAAVLHQLDAEARQAPLAPPAAESRPRSKRKCKRKHHRKRGRSHSSDSSESRRDKRRRKKRKCKSTSSKASRHRSQS